jgi:hypothetical protein
MLVALCISLSLNVLLIFWVFNLFDKIDGARKVIDKLLDK